MWIEEACHLGELRRIQPLEQRELASFQDGGERKEVPWGSGQVPSKILYTLGESTFPFRHGSFRQGESVLGLYEKRRDDKRSKTSNLKTLNVFDVVAS